MQIICISGKAQHGKDTVAKLCQARLESAGKRVLILHYADLLKYICQQFFGWDGEKDEAGRQLLQYVGTDVVRKKQPEFWVDFVIQILKLFPKEWDYVLIPDCRFPNEIESLKQAGFATTHLRVIRPNFDNHLTKAQQQHPSETALDYTLPDQYLYNSGSLEDLKRIVKGVSL